MKKTIFLAAAVASLAILPTTAQAVPIAGDLTLAGTVVVTATDIDWLANGAGNEFIVLQDTNSDYFDDLAFTFGDALDLNAFLQPAGPAGFPPLANFLTFDADPGLSFTLTGISLCDPVNCFFPGTPFNVFQTPNGQGGFNSTIQLAMRGTVQDTTGPNGTGEVGNFEATYSADFVGQTIADLIADFVADGQITAPYSAELIVVTTPSQVPEPATLLTFGAGTALMAAHRRRKAKKAAKV